MGDEKLFLVIVIDVDDDLGSIGIETPVIGEDEVRRVAEAFGLQRPEDSDLNAIYKGLKIYREQVGSGRRSEIVLLSGDPVNTLRAHKRIIEGLEEALEKLGVSPGSVEALIVSDGAEDETVIPLISSRVKLIGLERIVVTQHVGIETTYVILGRLIKKAIFEPRFSKYFVGVPGVILLSAALLAMTGWFTYAVQLGALILAVAMIIRGFSLEPYIERMMQEAKQFFVPGGEHYHLIIVANTTLLVNFLITVFLVYYNWSTVEDVVHRIAYILGYPLVILGFGIVAFQVGRLMVYMETNRKKMYDEVLKIMVTTTLVLAGYVLGDSLESLPSNPSSDLLSSVIIESGFLHILFAGLGIIAMVYVYLRVTGRYVVEDSTSQNSSEHSDTK